MIHADLECLECLLEKMRSCQTNIEKSLTEKKKTYVFWLFNIYKLFA